MLTAKRAYKCYVNARGEVTLAAKQDAYNNERLANACVDATLGRVLR